MSGGIITVLQSEAQRGFFSIIYDVEANCVALKLNYHLDSWYVYFNADANVLIYSYNAISDNRYILM